MIDREGANDKVREVKKRRIRREGRRERSGERR